MSYLGLTLTDLLKNNASGKEVTDFYRDRISRIDDEINSVLEYDLQEADSKPKGRLNGMPLLFKDNIATKELATTASSRVLEGFQSPYTATISNKLEDAGATVLGKTNMDAWAHGSSTETSDFGVTKNPHNLDYVPGGSSGGSAAAVAAGLAPASIGTETAGSIRLPAAWSGVVGLKPTYGRVSRYGIVAMGSSWDCPGPMTQTVEDAALLLEIMAGKDPRDGSSMDKPVEEYTKALDKRETYTIGVSDVYLKDCSKDVKKYYERALDELKMLGHTLKKVSLIDPKYSISVYMTLQRSEVSSNLARYDGIRYGQNRSHFGEEAERRIMLGTYALSSGYYDAYYKKAQKVRYLIRKDFEKAFNDVDLIFAPTAPITATKIGSSNDYAFYGEMMDILTEPAAAAGIPAISIPAGIGQNDLPVGVQFMAPAFEESRLLNAAHHLETELAFDRLAVMKKYE